MMLAVLGLTLFAISHVALAMPAEVGPEYLNMLRATGRDEEFAKLMGISDVNLVRESNERSEEALFYGASPLGDILLTPEQTEQAEQDRQVINFPKYPGSKWPTNEIPYTITTSDFTPSQITHIEQSIAALNNVLTKLKIRPCRDGDKDYVTIFSGRGCYARLGRGGGSQPLSLQSNGCLRAGTIQHEFIHSAGFVHEHMRPDRDNFIRILEENIPESWRSQYKKVASSDFDLKGPYDYYSVMHYSIPAPETRRDAFEVLRSADRSRIGQRNGPSQTDIDKINNVYQ